MKKIILSTLITLLITGCATFEITNTKNTKEHILKDNLKCDSFIEYQDSDSIIRLPNGKYIHGTKTFDNKHYDSDQDSGAISAKEAEYYVLLAIDARQYVKEKFNNLNDKDTIIYDGSITTNETSTIDENGNETIIDVYSNSNSMTVKKAKKIAYEDFIEADSKKESKNLSDKKSKLSKNLPKTTYLYRVVTNEKDKYEIHYYNVSKNDYSAYVHQLKENQFVSMDSNSPEENFLARNDKNLTVNVHYNSDAKTISSMIYK